jgi:PadR family transcriptional regulator, regulatory protein AphA
MKRNRSRYAVLGLIADGGRTGYEVRKDAVNMLSHFWHESDGQIYPILRQLTDQGLAECVDETEPGGRRRHRYHATEDGLAELADWLAQPAVPVPPRLEILLKLFFGRHARPGDLRRVLAAYRERAAAAAAQLAAVEQTVAGDDQAGPDLAYWKLTVAFGLTTLRAVLAWCDEAESALAAVEAAS